MAKIAAAKDEETADLTDDEWTTKSTKYLGTLDNAVEKCEEDELMGKLKGWLSVAKKFKDFLLAAAQKNPTKSQLADFFDDWLDNLTDNDEDEENGLIEKFGLWQLEKYGDVDSDDEDEQDEQNEEDAEDEEDEEDDEDQ